MNAAAWLADGAPLEPTGGPGYLLREAGETMPQNAEGLQADGETR